MMTYGDKIQRPRSLIIALLSAICLTLLLPAVASAQAVLLRSNPAQDAVLPTPPSQVQMWFSEDLNPILSTAQVVDSERERVDMNDAHVSPTNGKELDVSLQANLPPGVYVVVWRTDSADDGHALLGSFLFTAARVDGSVPQLAAGNNPGQGILGDANGGNAGTLDALALFNLLAVTLVELGVVFWVGAQIWLNFVLSTVFEKHTEEQELNQHIEERFVRRFSLPTLGVLLLANLGVLYGQALVLTGGDWLSAFSPHLLSEQITSSRFGTYWLVRLVVLLLAAGVGLSMRRSKKRSQLYALLTLLNLFLGALLLLAITMSGQAAAVSAPQQPYSVIIDWLHLVATALWVGGIFTILLIYLPVLKLRALSARARSLLTILPHSSPLAIVGVAVIAATGPLSAAFHLTSVDQLISTAYGRALLVKILLTGILLATSASHLFWLCPRLRKAYRKYAYASERLQKIEASSANELLTQGETSGARNVSTGDAQAERSPVNGAPVVSGQVQESLLRADKLLARQVKAREKHLTRGITYLARMLRWESWLGVAVLVCAGLMNVFAGTLVPINTVSQQSGANGAPAGAFTSTARASDGTYRVTLTISPNRFGSNVFTVQVINVQSGKTPGPNEISVSVSLTMLDMDMGTDSLDLLPDGKGGFSGSHDLFMSGNWDLKVQIRTQNKVHTATFQLFTPF